MAGKDISINNHMKNWSKTKKGRLEFRSALVEKGFFQCGFKSDDDAYSCYVSFEEEMTYDNLLSLHTRLGLFALIGLAQRVGKQSE